MTLADFMKLVREMRAAQKSYFKNRGYDAQSAAMKLERDVDKVMADHDGGQGKLFGVDTQRQPERPSEFTFERTTCRNCCEIQVGCTGHRIELLVNGDDLTASQVAFMQEVAAVLNRHFPLDKIPE